MSTALMSQLSLTECTNRIAKLGMVLALSIA